MILITQLTALQPEVKLLLPGTAVSCSLLSQQLHQTDPQHPALTIGWRMIDRSHSAASPDCFVVTDAMEQEGVSSLQPLSQLQPNSTHAYREFCLNTGDYRLTGVEQVTVMLEIEPVS